jgi:outer membrane receptor protein involved in Fe transport
VTPGVSPLLPNNRMGFAPEYTVSLAVNYEHDVSEDLKMRANVTARYNTEYNTGSDLNPEKLQDEYALVNARLGLSGQDERWAVELWGQNVFDQDYYQVVFDATFQSTQKDAFLGAPRTFGVTLRLKQ